MNNSEVINEFLHKKKAKTNLRYIQNGYYMYKGRTLETDGKVLINYNTPIAYFDNYGILYLNCEKYSVTTSKIQSKLYSYVYTKEIIANKVTEKEIKELMKKEKMEV